MRIKSVFSGASAWEMFYSKANSVFFHTFRSALEAFYQTSNNIADQLRTLTKGSICSLPSWVCHRICHIHIALFQTTGIPLTSGNLCKTADQTCISSIGNIANYSSSQPERSRPCREYTGRIIHSKGHLSVFISGVGSHNNRNTQTCFFCHQVHLVHPGSHIFRFWVLTKNKVTQSPIYNGLCCSQCA